MSGETCLKVLHHRGRGHYSDRHIVRFGLVESAGEESHEESHDDQSRHTDSCQAFEDTPNVSCRLIIVHYCLLFDLGKSVHIELDNRGDPLGNGWMCRLLGQEAIEQEVGKQRSDQEARRRIRVDHGNDPSLLGVP